MIKIYQLVNIILIILLFGSFKTNPEEEKEEVRNFR